MESHAKLFGHPIHPMLVDFPLGLLPTAVIFDVVYLSTRNAGWTQLAFWMIAVGVIGALLAAVFGLVDWLAIPAGTRAKRIGLLHGGGNVVVVGLFVASWILRQRAGGIPSRLAIGLGFVGVALAVVTGWLGGELVDRLGVGVDEGANLDAPSSLSHTHISSAPHPHPIAR
jgi:uncharacterized membrane protein